MTIESRVFQLEKQMSGVLQWQKEHNSPAPVPVPTPTPTPVSTPVPTPVPVPVPPSTGSIPFDQTYGYVLDGLSYKTLVNAVVAGYGGNPHFAIQVNNGATAKGIVISHMDAHDMPAYIGYFGGGDGITIESLSASQAQDANQCAMRYGGGKGHALVQSNIDTSKGVNDMLRCYGDAEVVVDHCELIGGRINVSWPDNIPGGSRGGNLTIRNSIIERNQPGGLGYPLQINVYPGGKLTLENVKRRTAVGLLVPYTLVDIDGDKSGVTITN